MGPEVRAQLLRHSLKQGLDIGYVVLAHLFYLSVVRFQPALQD
jgi:hypothetical protein